ncbi:MAG: hypothetical protein ACOYOV_00070 [Bacteroidales bacterium]
MKLLLVFILSISIAHAGNVSVIAKGTPAPFDGVLFSREMEKQIRQTNLDNVYLKQQNASLTRLNDLSEQETSIVTKRYENMALKVNELAEKQIKADNASFWKSTLYFVAGAIMTGIITYSVTRSLTVVP